MDLSPGGATPPITVFAGWIVFLLKFISAQLLMLLCAAFRSTGFSLCSTQAKPWTHQFCNEHKILACAPQGFLPSTVHADSFAACTRPQTRNCPRGQLK